MSCSTDSVFGTQIYVQVFTKAHLWLHYESLQALILCCCRIHCVVICVSTSRSHYSFLRSFVYIVLVSTQCMLHILPIFSLILFAWVILGEKKKLLFLCMPPCVHSLVPSSVKAKYSQYFFHIQLCSGEMGNSIITHSFQVFPMVNRCLVKLTWRVVTLECEKTIYFWNSSHV